MRYAMGVAVFFGMLGVTFFGLVMTPAFYVTLRALSGNRPLVHHAVDHPEIVSPSIWLAGSPAPANKVREMVGG
jgi:multidrug efflux pump